MEVMTMKKSCLLAGLAAVVLMGASPARAQTIMAVSRAA
jgi:hypothetical protein